jgi:hypothetical protein
MKKGDKVVLRDDPNGQEFCVARIHGDVVTVLDYKDCELRYEMSLLRPVSMSSGEERN